MSLKLFTRVTALIVGLSGLASIAQAAPVTYSFSTGTLNSGFFCGGIPSCSPHPWSSFTSSAFVQGSFVYDSSLPQTLTASNGSAIYGGNPSSFSGLSGTVDGHSFSDLRGFTQVGNETFALTNFLASPPTTTMVDFLGLTAEPPLNSPNPHNISGFTVGGYSLVNVRMFWIEGSNMPELVPDLFDNQALPAVLPSFHGRLALDFVPTGNTNLSYVPASVFFDGLTVTAVPEPETYAMLLAGLGVLAFVARRRKMKETS